MVQWVQAFRDHRRPTLASAGGTDEKKVGAGTRSQANDSAVGIGEFVLELPTYNGTRGFCGVWWEDMTISLRMMGTMKSKWLPVAVTQIKGCKRGRDRLTAVHNDHPNWSVDEVMAEFVDIQDENSLDSLMEMWRVVRQNPKERIRDHETRFSRLVRALGRQAHAIQEREQFLVFKATVPLKDKLIKEHESKNMAAVVEFVDKIEPVEKTEASRLHFLLQTR